MKQTIFFVVVLAVAMGVTLASAEWRGKEIVQDDVLYIQNPETPVQEVRVELKELWRRGGDDDDLLFGRVSELVHDGGGNLYMLDSQLSEILVFSPTGEHLRTIGRAGEGPGEFTNGSDMYLGPDGLLGIVRIFPGRVFQLGIDGSPADHFRLPAEADGSFQLVYNGQAAGDRIVLAGAKQQSESGKQIQVSHLKAYDKNGNVLADYYDESSETRFGGMKFEEKIFSNFTQRWALASDGRVAVAADYDHYRIRLYDAKGVLNRIIDRPGYTALVRTASEKKRLQKFFDGITSWSPNSTFKVSDTHVAVGRAWFRDNGNLWVLPSRGSRATDDGIFASFDEYNPDGHFVRRVHVVGDGDAVEDGIFFASDRMYRMTDLFGAVMAALGGDEDSELDGDVEPLQLVAYQLNVPAMRP